MSKFSSKPHYNAYLTTLSEFETLLLPGDASNNGHSSYTHGSAKLEGLVLYLLGQFSGWCQDNGIWPLVNVL